MKSRCDGVWDPQSKRHCLCMHACTDVRLVLHINLYEHDPQPPQKKFCKARLASWKVLEGPEVGRMDPTIASMENQVRNHVVLVAENGGGGGARLLNTSTHALNLVWRLEGLWMMGH